MCSYKIILYPLVISVHFLLPYCAARPIRWPSAGTPDRRQAGRDNRSPCRWPCAGSSPRRTGDRPDAQPFADPLAVRRFERRVLGVAASCQFDGRATDCEIML